MATIHPVSMRDTARQVTLTIKLVHVKRTRFRLAIFTGLLRLACLINPCTVVLDSGDS
jgi:hypothetical protein